MRHRMASKKAVAFAMAIVLLASGLAAIGRPLPIVADLGDGHTRAHGHDTYKLKDDFQMKHGRITRNLAKGESLAVCSTDFPEATKTAINRWNDALQHEVLTFEADSSKCQSASSSTTRNPENGVDAVFVSVGTVANGRIQGSVLPTSSDEHTCPTTVYACVRQDDVHEEDGSVWRTRFGRLEVIVNPEQFCRDIGESPTPECDATTQSADQQTDDDLQRLIAHELGHALSLGDYFCQHRDPKNMDATTNQHPDFINEPTIMDSFLLLGKGRACRSTHGTPTQIDTDDYRTIYRPAKVTEASGTANGRAVTLTWNQSDVFVESEFEIQRASGTVWVVEAIAEVNEELIALPNQPGGVQHYRIVARTMALPEDESGHGHAHGTPSAEIEVHLQLAAPNNVHVTSRTANSLTLAWDSVNGADGYEVKRTEGNGETTPQAASGATSHLFTDLSANTQYKLYVRAKLSTNSALTSAWAETPLTMTLRPPQPMGWVLTLPSVHDTETRWIVVFVPPFGQCNEFEEQRTKSTTVTIYLFYEWEDGTGWVARAIESESVLYSPWRRTGKAKVCEIPIRDGAWLLPAGEYELRWAAQQLRFTVPEDGQVELRSLRLDSGEDAAVFSVAGGAELVVTPDMLAEDAVTGLAGTSDPTLAALSSSLELAQADSTQPTPATETPCAEVAKPEIGAVEVDLADKACTIVRGGGAIKVSDGTGTLNLSLPTERDWLALAARHSAENDADAFWFIDLATGGWIVLNPANGAELERHTPADATGLSALLDAIAASASTPATE